MGRTNDLKALEHFFAPWTPKTQKKVSTGRQSVNKCNG
jgi:hypothetical protein